MFSRRFRLNSISTELLFRSKMAFRLQFVPLVALRRVGAVAVATPRPRAGRAAAAAVCLRVARVAVAVRPVADVDDVNVLNSHTRLFSSSVPACHHAPTIKFAQIRMDFIVEAVDRYSKTGG